MGKFPFVCLQEQLFLRHINVILFRKDTDDLLECLFVRRSEIDRDSESGNKRQFFLHCIVRVKFLVSVRLVTECLPDQMTAV